MARNNLMSAPPTVDAVRPALVSLPTGGDESVEDTLSQIRVYSPDRHEPVVIAFLPPALRLVGYGTDAVVVAHPSRPGLVFKVYVEAALDALEDEYRAYERLAGSPLFASCVDRGEFYLTLSYEAGPTLYDCLVEGLAVAPAVMADVEAARAYAREVGLHPKDVHLKNVIVQDGRAKLIDVSKYIAAGDDDPVWEALAEGYRRFYPKIRGRAIPVWIIEMAKRAYRDQSPDQFRLDAFARRMLRVLATRHVTSAGRRSPVEAA